MGDPNRLSERPADPLEAGLLDALREPTAPSAAEAAAMWGELSAQLGALGLVASGSAAAAALAGGAASAGAPATASTGGKGLGALLAKLLPKAALGKLLAVGVVGGAAVGTAWLAPEARPAAAPREGRRVFAAPARPAPPRVEEPDSISPEVAPPPAQPARTEPAPGRRAPAPRADPRALDEAAHWLAAAHRALQAGELAEVDGLLRRLARSPAAPALAQEREVLAIELLARRGRHAAAAEASRRFLSAHPKSPYASTLGRFVTQP